jgi:hypothetical protein
LSRLIPDKNGYISVDQIKTFVAERQ